MHLAYRREDLLNTRLSFPEDFFLLPGTPRKKLKFLRQLHCHEMSKVNVACRHFYLELSVAVTVVPYCITMNDCIQIQAAAAGSNTLQEPAKFEVHFVIHYLLHEVHSAAEIHHLIFENEPNLMNQQNNIGPCE